MSEQYKISSATLKDIINKIPKEHWGSVIGELELCLKQLQGTIDMVKLVAESMAEATGEDIDIASVLEFPEEITWINDGKRDNTINFVDGESDEHFGSIKYENGESK